MTRDFYYERQPYHCRRICQELLTRPYLPRYTRCQTLQLIATTYQYHIAKKFLLEALEVCDGLDFINSTPFAKLLRDATNKMLAELEGKIQSEDLFNEAGQYIGPRILDDEGGFAAEEAMIGDTSSDDDLLSDNASDSEDIDEEGDVPVEQTVEERIKELKIKETPVPKPSRLSKAARKAGWMSASEYSPPSEDLSRKGERVPPTNLEELKRYIERSLADHDAMTLALLESVQRISEKGIAGGATEGEDTEAIVKYAELEKALKRLTKNLEKAIKLAKGRFQF